MSTVMFAFATRLARVINSAIFPSKMNPSSLGGSSSTGQSVRVCSRSARARSNSCAAARSSRIEFVVATDSMSALGTYRILNRTIGGNPDGQDLLVRFPSRRFGTECERYTLVVNTIGIGADYNRDPCNQRKRVE